MALGADMEKFSKMLQEDGLLMDKEEMLLTMRENIDSMVLELNSLKKKIDYYLNDMDMLPVNHELDLPEEFNSALTSYQNNSDDLV